MRRKIKINKVNRPPLTRKARAAIKLYVDLKSPEGLYFLREDGIDCVLKADRMPREKLYEYLENKGYKWKTDKGYGDGYWVKKE
jgi:hypothetical protein